MADLDAEFDKEQSLDDSFDKEPEVKAKGPKGKEPSLMNAVERGAGSGVTFGSQPVLAGLGAAGMQALSPLTGVDMGPKSGANMEALMAAYKEMQKDQMQKNQAAQAAHPTAYGASQIAGSIPTAIAGGAAGVGAGAQGAAMGLGTYAGNTTDPTLRGAAGSAITGALLGKGAEAALPGAIGAVKGVGKAVAAPFVAGAKKVASALGSDVAPEVMQDAYQRGTEGQQLPLFPSNKFNNSPQGRAIANETKNSALAFTNRMKGVEQSLGADIGQSIQDAAAEGRTVNVDKELQEFKQQIDDGVEANRIKPEEAEQLHGAIDSLLFKEAPQEAEQMGSVKQVQKFAPDEASGEMRPVGMKRTVSLKGAKPEDLQNVQDIEDLIPGKQAPKAIPSDKYNYNIDPEDFNQDIYKGLGEDEELPSVLGKAPVPPQADPYEMDPVEWKKTMQKNWGWPDEAFEQAEQKGGISDISGANPEDIQGRQISSQAKIMQPATEGVTRGELPVQRLYAAKQDFQDLGTSLFNTEGTMPASRQMVKSIQQMINDKLGEAVPDFAQKLQLYNKFLEYLPETIASKGNSAQLSGVRLSDMPNPELKVKESVENLISDLNKGGAASQQAQQTMSELDHSLDNLMAVDNSAKAASEIQNKPYQSIFSRLGLNKDQIMQHLEGQAKKANTVNTWMGNKSVDLSAPTSITDTIKQATGKTGVAAANLAGRFVGNQLYSAGDETLKGVATMLATNPETKNLGQALMNAISKGDTVARNAAIFSAMQNPKARSLIDPSLKEDIDKKNQNSPIGTAPSGQSKYSF